MKRSGRRLLIAAGAAVALFCATSDFSQDLSGAAYELIQQGVAMLHTISQAG